MIIIIFSRRDIDKYSLYKKSLKIPNVIRIQKSLTHSNHISYAMVNVVASCVVDREFKPRTT